MKVFLLIDNLSSGGAQRQFVYLAKGLKERGYEVLCCTYWPKLDFYQPLLETAGIPIISNPEASKIWKRSYCITKSIRTFKPDAVIAYLDTPSLLACMARFCCKFRLIVSERNTTTQKIQLLDRIKYALYHQADYIVPNSYSQEHFIRQYYPTLSTRVRVITNAIDIKRFTPPPRPPQNKVPRVISIGRMSKQKNYLGMVEVVHLLKKQSIAAEFHWYLGKSMNAEYFQKVQNKIQEYDLADYIFFHKTDPNIELQYQRSDIFWLASLYEGFPNVLCEAMACGLPVICSNVCDNPFIVTEGVHGFLADPHDNIAMTRTLKRMLTLSQEQRHKMGKTGAVRIADLCSEDTFLNRYISLL